MLQKYYVNLVSQTATLSLQVVAGNDDTVSLLVCLS